MIKIIQLTLLFSLEGVLIGLILYSIPNYLKFEDITLSPYYSLVLLIPYFLKFLIAPFFDSLAITKIGKRKSQLVILLIGFGTFLYFIPISKEQLQLTMLYISIFLAILDIPIQAWMAETHPQSGALFQYIGILIGAFVGAYGFATFNSVPFCNQYIYATPQEIPMITLPEAIKDIGLYSFALAIVIIFQQESATSLSPLMEIYRSQCSLQNNKHLKSLLIFLSSYRILLLPIDLIHQYLLNTQFTEGQIQFLQIVAFPFACLLPFYLKKILKDGRLELRFILIFQVYKILFSIGVMIMIYFLQVDFKFPYRDLIINVGLIIIWLLNISTIIMGYSYIYKVNNSCVSATYVSILSSGLIFQSILSTILQNNLHSFQLIWVIGILLYFVYLRKQEITIIDQDQSAEFTLEIDVKKETLLSKEMITLS